MKNSTDNTNLSAKANAIVDALAKAYPNAGCELEFGSVFQLLVAVILSAQCTDKRVNLVTAELFKTAQTPNDFADMPQEVLEKKIFSCGFYRSKATAIKSASKDILERFNGEVPTTLDQLTSLRGVGRKTANVILSVAYGKDAVAVDTHVFRVSHRLALSKGKTPDAVERDLMSLYSGERLSVLHHVLIFHGRYCCHSKKPDCTGCPVADLCEYTAKNLTNT